MNTYLKIINIYIHKDKKKIHIYQVFNMNLYHEHLLLIYMDGYC